MTNSSPIIGTISQWGEVSKQKKPKAKNDTFTTTIVDSAAGNARTGRGGRIEGGRGRGRATERGGRGGSRGKSTFPATNGAPSTRPKETPLSVPTEESSAWDTPKPADDTTGGWGESTETPAPAVADSTPAPATSTPSAPAPTPVSNGPKTWASMLRQSAVPKPAPKPKEAPAPTPAEPTVEPLPLTEPTPAEPEPEVPAVQEQPAEAVEETTPTAPEQAPVVVPEIALAPSKDELTEENLEQVEDRSHPPLTETAASEAADSWNPRVGDVSAVATPLSAPKQETLKAPSSGYAATAIKATERNPIRTPSYQRRVLEQEEAVRMPSHRDQVDRAAVQFGAFSLNDEDDIDGDREEPETRAQPPVDSPVSQPRASLPPVQAPASVPEPYAAQQKQAPILPPTGPSGTASSPFSLSRELYTNPMRSAAVAPPQSLPSAAPQGSYPFPVVPAHADPSIINSALMPPFAPTAAQSLGQTPQQFGRFGQAAPQEPSVFPSQKPFDAFGQQPSTVPSTQSQYEGSFASQAPPSQSQAQQQPSGAFSSAPSDYSSYYTADAQSRSQYNNYYNSQQYGQQGGSQGPPEGPSSQQQQRGYGSGSYNSAPLNENLSQYPQSTAHTQATQARYGAAAAVDNSGNTTPNPSAAQAPQQSGVGAQSQSHGQQPDYNYAQHPYFTSPYYAAYMNQQQYGGYNQGGYGGPYGKGGYGQPQQYGMNPQGPYGAHGSSPAGSYAQSSLHRADSGGAGAAPGLGEYGRAGPAQAASQPALGGSGFGGHDTYGRAGPYGSQAGQSYSGAGAQQGIPPVDDLKPFGEAKTGSGPSPSMGAAARPGSAANNGPSQTGLPPAQSGQQSGLGYGGYPSHLQQGGHNLHGAQSGASGYGMGASSAQGHNNNPYGQYGNQGFGNSYGNYGNQPRGGWGGNYH